MFMATVMDNAMVTMGMYSQQEQQGMVDICAHVLCADCVVYKKNKCLIAQEFHMAIRQQCV